MRHDMDTLLAKGPHLLAVLIVVAGLGVWSDPILHEERVGVRQEAKTTSANHEDNSSTAEWPMVAANPQRTSWTPEEVRGQLRPLWYRPIEPYINYKVQIIAANGLLYVSTARGLYALHAENGEVLWIYPTELPLGHSPTIANGVVYVGGYDRQIHAVDALSGEPIPTWTPHIAGAGFETNPLVVDGRVYAGSRDGFMYAFDATTGELIWRFRTDGPILFSAAYQDGTIYFASNDSHAYALNAASGSLVWKSAKLPGAGFHSYWPVVYGDWIVFAGSNNYRVAGWRDPVLGSELQITSQERDELYPNHELDPRGTLIGPVGTEPGDWASGTVTIDASRPTVTANGSTKPITEYLEAKPWRRSVFILNRSTGQEYSFDWDGDDKPEYAPFVWTGTHSGNRYPPVIGTDGILYQQNGYMSDPWIPGGQATGWKFGTPFISRVSVAWNAVDEPMALSAGGSLIYWTNTVDRQGGAYDITIPLNTPGRDWDYWSYDLGQLIPSYDIGYYLPPDSVRDYNKVYGNANGVYGTHGVENPLIPYQGKLYVHRGNSVIAFGITEGDAVQLPMAKTQSAHDPPPPITLEQVRQKLAVEIEKILDAGHLRPGYHSSGLVDPHLETGAYLLDYWRCPSETAYALIRALPHLDSGLGQRTREFLLQEYVAYPPYAIAHIGWRDGVSREAFDLPPEIDLQRLSYSPQPEESADWWSYPQYCFYGLWKYAQEFDNADDMFAHIKDKIETPPGNDVLAEHPYIHNAYIAGYIGYLELEKMAGEPESAAMRAELGRLLDLRVTAFTKDSPFVDSDVDYRRSLNISRNFMYLVPELADYLDTYARAKVQEAIDEYVRIAPNWFVSKYDATYGEGTLQPLYDYHSVFQAKALILEEPREELLKYLDVPAFARGDLFYIQNLVSTLEAQPSFQKTASPLSGDQGAVISFALSFLGDGNTLTLTDTLPYGLSAPFDYILEGTIEQPSYDSAHRRLTWSDSPVAAQQVVIGYSANIDTDLSSVLNNTAELSGETRPLSITTATIFANPYRMHLPLLFRTR